MPHHGAACCKAPSNATAPSCTRRRYTLAATPLAYTLLKGETGELN